VGAVDGDAARADGARRRERLLLLVPLGVALAFGLLLVPRRAIPDEVPLPIIDAAGLSRESEADRVLASRAQESPLPGPIRALGGALRTFHGLEARQADDRELANARRGVDVALEGLGGEGEEGLLELRAAQLEGFLRELRRFEAGGDESTELDELGGAVIRTLRTEGWCEGHHLLAPEPAMRAMFKVMWDAFVGFEGRAAFQPPLNQQRALYALYLSHPPLPSQVRARLASARRGATDAAACERIAGVERGAMEVSRLERIARLTAIDSKYPAAYARGVVQYRRGDYTGSVAAFRDWLAEHPDGPLALRARAYLRGAMAGGED